ncbi:ATP-binding cassette domain-containing protein, partial [Bacillus altitudinis]
MEEISLTIKNINKSYNEKVVFKNFEITLYKNKVNCILGKSGCGKSTLLNVISKIIKNDTELYSEIDDMQISYIFQEDRLIDWITIEDNINLVLKKNYKKSD